MSSPFVRLALPTNSTLEGPRILGDGQHAVVEYDFQKDDGTTEWASVAFEDVLQLEFRAAPCCTAADVVKPTEVRAQDTSLRLTAIQELWEEAVGWQEWQQTRGGFSRYRHFTIYFDDAGCVDVVAAHCQPSAST